MPEYVELVKARRGETALLEDNGSGFPPLDGGVDGGEGEGGDGDYPFTGRLKVLLIGNETGDWREAIKEECEGYAWLDPYLSDDADAADVMLDMALQADLVVCYVDGWDAPDVDMCVAAGYAHCMATALLLIDTAVKPRGAELLRSTATRTFGGLGAAIGYLQGYRDAVDDMLDDGDPVGDEGEE
jgi:hypothetical protein